MHTFLWFIDNGNIVGTFTFYIKAL